MSHRRWPWLVFFIGAAVMALPSPHVAAEQEFPAGNRVLLVLPPEFHPLSGGTKYTVRAGGLGALCTVEGAGYFGARILLPSGSHIHGIEAAFDDNSEHGFGVVALYRSGEGTRDLLGLTPMSLARPLREVVAFRLADPEIVREGFQYWLQVTLTAPEVCLRFVRVVYRSG